MCTSRVDNKFTSLLVRSVYSPLIGLKDKEDFKMAILRTEEVSSSRDDFNIDIPIVERKETIDAKVEGVLFHRYTFPCELMLKQHQKEYIQHIQSLIRDGAECILVDGQLVYKKY